MTKHDERSATSGLIKTAQEFYASLLTDFEATVRDCVSESFFLDNPLPEQIPFGGRYEGQEGLRRYLTEIATAIDMGPLAFEEWIQSGNTVVARGSESSLVRATGKRYTMRFVHWLEFDGDGKLASMWEFNDTAALLEAFRADPE